MVAFTEVVATPPAVWLRFFLRGCSVAAAAAAGRCIKNPEERCQIPSPAHLDRSEKRNGG